MEYCVSIVGADALGFSLTASMMWCHVVMEIYIMEMMLCLFWENVSYICYLDRADLLMTENS